MSSAGYKPRAARAGSGGNASVGDRGDVVTSDFGASVTSVNEASTVLAAAARRSPRGCYPLAAWLAEQD